MEERQCISHCKKQGSTKFWVGEIAVAKIKIIKNFLRSHPRIYEFITSIYVWKLKYKKKKLLRTKQPSLEKNQNKSSRSSLQFTESDLMLIKSCNSVIRIKIARRMHVLGNLSMNQGHLRKSEKCFEVATALYEPFSIRYVTTLRSLAVVKFLIGEMNQAKELFFKATKRTRYLKQLSTESDWITVLGQTWTPAIGHLCLIDFYIKQFELGMAKFSKAKKIVVGADIESLPFSFLAKKFTELDIEFKKFCKKYSIEDYYNENKPAEKKRTYQELSKIEQGVIVEEFWDYDFGGDECYFYTHGIAKIQQAWEKEKRAPLLKLNPQENESLDMLLGDMGVPKDAWYVCLHVRESGYHKKWNKMYPSLRDADIEDYISAIEEITARGGWVIRMGDESMRPVPEMEKLVDYCHSDFKADSADILLLAGCRFLLGTNSGLATVPGIFGRPMVLTNWVPIALPLWFGQDLMIPKLFRDKTNDEILSLQQMLSTKAGSIQNIDECPEHLEVIANTPDEIREAVVEMIDRLEGNFKDVENDKAMQKKYFELCENYGSYKGSNLGYKFAQKYNIL